MELTMLQKAVMTRLRGGRMEKSISVADVCRKFSQVLRDVRKGQTYVITSHGKSVARFAPFIRYSLHSGKLAGGKLHTSS